MKGFEFPLVTVPVASRSYERWLGALFYDRYQRATPREAFKSAVRTIEARTYATKKSFQMFPRIAMVQNTDGDDVVFLDIGDQTGRAIKVDHTGYTVIDDPPVKFSSPRGRRR